MNTDYPIQHDPKVPAGAQEPLSNDSERKSTHGGVFDQNTMSFCRGQNVQGRAASLCNPNDADGAASRPFANVDGMACDSPVAPTVTPVDRRTIEGSYPGDSRSKPGDTAASSLAKSANGAGPRGPAGQFPNGRRDATLGSFSKDSANQTFPGNVGDSDAGN